MNNSLAPIPECLFDEATEWLIRLRATDADSDLWHAFYQWYNAAPIHQQAYEQVSELWDDLSVIGAFPAEQAPANKSRPNSLLSKLLRICKGQMWWPLLAVCSFALFLVAVIFPTSTPESRWDSTYTTGIGEQTTVSLSDGSSVYLNTDSVLQVRMIDKQRTVHLVKGEAFFDIQHNTEIPFVVKTAGGLVKVLGTQFNVLRGKYSSEITVINGSVAVAGSNSIAPVTLQLGQQVAIGRQGVTATPIRVDTNAVAAWKQGKLIYNGDPLEKVVRDLARYIDGDLRIADAQLKSMEVVAVFAIKGREQQQILQLFEKAFSVRTKRVSNQLTMVYADTVEVTK